MVLGMLSLLELSSASLEEPLLSVECHNTLLLTKGIWLPIQTVTACQERQ